MVNDGIILKRINIFINPATYLRIRNEIDFHNKNVVVRYDSLVLWVISKLFQFIPGERGAFDMSSLAPQIIQGCVEKKSAVLFVGGTFQDALIFEQKLKSRYPKLNLLVKEGFQTDQKAILELVHRNSIKYFICGMGAPKQERLVTEIFAKTGIYCFTCGGFITQMAKADHTDYYPPLVVRLNIRFIYRLFKEPHVRMRLIDDYPRGIFFFIFDRFRQIVQANNYGRDR